MSDLIFGVDVDDVCADLLTAWLHKYRLLSGDSLYPQYLTSWNIDAQVKDPYLLREALKDVNYTESVSPIIGARDGVEALRTLGRVVFITSAPGMYGARSKFEWLQRHRFLPADDSLAAPDFFACYDKSLVYCDALFDDGAHNLDAVQMGRFRTVPVLISRPHNQGVGDRFWRLDGLHQAAEFVKGYFHL